MKSKDTYAKPSLESHIHRKIVHIGNTGFKTLRRYLIPISVGKKILTNELRYPEDLSLCELCDIYTRTWLVCDWRKSEMMMDPRFKSFSIYINRNTVQITPILGEATLQFTPILGEQDNTV